MRITHRVAPAITATALICLAACHKRPIEILPPPAAALDIQAIATGFEQLINEGCYLCLADVLKRYQGLPEAARQSPLLQPVTTRAALLYLLRRKELGIPPDDDWTAAQSIATANADTSPSARLLLEIERAVGWQALGVGEGFLDDERRVLSTPAQRQAWRTALEGEWRQSDVAAYVYLSLLCGLVQGSPADRAPVKEQYSASPLVQYRWATCGNSNEAALRQLVQADSRFVEARYFLGRLESNARRFAEAEADLFDSWRDIPRFTAAGVAAAELGLTGEQYDRTLSVLDAVLAIAPNHWRATLDKLKTLSSMNRSAEAIAVANQLIASGHWYQGDAYYWRAWNHYQLENTEAALADVRAAKEYEPRSVRVFTLAGLILMKQERWHDAKQEFVTALSLNAELCDVHSFLGFTTSRLSDWKEAAGYFEHAAGCYASVERALDAQILTASRQPTPDAWALRELAKLRRDLQATIEHEQSAIYNAAVTFANARMLDQARLYAKQAEAFPTYLDRARALLATIDDVK